jgi:hypothetical protein
MVTSFSAATLGARAEAAIRSRPPGTLSDKYPPPALVSELQRPSASAQAEIRGDPLYFLAKRVGQRRGWSCEVFDLYGKPTRKRYKTFVATWRPAGGAIRVVLVDEPVQRAVDQDQAGEGEDARGGGRHSMPDLDGRKSLKNRNFREIPWSGVHLRQ